MYSYSKMCGFWIFWSGNSALNWKHLCSQKRNSNFPLQKLKNTGILDLWLECLCGNCRNFAFHSWRWVVCGLGTLRRNNFIIICNSTDHYIFDRHSRLSYYCISLDRNGGLRLKCTKIILDYLRRFGTWSFFWYAAGKTIQTLRGIVDLLLLSCPYKYYD